MAMPRMPAATARERATLAAGQWCAALLMAQFVGGRAARDALYLVNQGAETLPAVVLASAVVSAMVALAWSRLLARVTPVRVLVTVLLGGAALFIAIWILFPYDSRAGAIALYVQVTVLGPLLGSGLWLVASERFDPRTARTAFARMVAAGTVGGLVAGLVTERAAAEWGALSVLLLLAAGSVIAAYGMHRLGTCAPLSGTVRPASSPTRGDSGVRVLARTPFLRNLAALVFLSALAVTMLDFLFKSQAAATLTGGKLFRFFAWYYAAAGVILFVVQVAAHDFALNRLGLARTMMAPAVAVVVGGLSAVVCPHLAAVTVARGAESVLRGSLFRTTYEIFFTPVPAADKRAAKALIDVGVDRVGEGTGAVLIAVVVVVAATSHYRTLLILAIAASIGVLIVATRLTSGYTQALARSLREQAIALSLSSVRDRTTRAVVWHTMAQAMPLATTRLNLQQEQDGVTHLPKGAVFDQDVLQILSLRSQEAARVARVLDPRNRLSAPLIAHVVALLESPALAGMAAQALSAVARDHAGALTDAMLDPRRSPGVRRRLARILAGNPTQRAVDGLLMALSSGDFSVRVQSGRSLAQIHIDHPTLRIHPSEVLTAVRDELAQGKAVWESHRSPNATDDDDHATFDDEHVPEQVHHGLAHVFTLLSLVLPSEPLHIAYRGLHTDDRALRGTALEYLESVLPPDVRDVLWPLLADDQPRPPLALPRKEAITRLVEAHPSILLNLQQRARRVSPASQNQEDRTGR